MQAARREKYLYREREKFYGGEKAVTEELSEPVSPGQEYYKKDTSKLSTSRLKVISVDYEHGETALVEPYNFRDSKWFGPSAQRIMRISHLLTNYDLVDPV